MVLPNRPSGLPEKERACYAGYSVVKVLGNGLYPLKRKASENGVCRHTMVILSILGSPSDSDCEAAVEDGEAELSGDEDELPQPASITSKRAPAVSGLHIRVPFMKNHPFLF